ncbi:Restriction endonuclease [Priestia aryabhattai B8W22]|uniref:restriction endonuclease n=1 Tax=Priestia aryabhattai TaxID=412384 RepID=UPI00088B2DC7|nr:Restriction endonuclease [Priestia aryabhattai B8W22]
MDTYIKFEDLVYADLTVEAIYEGGPKDNVSDDPISKLLKCENMGGFRISGSKKDHRYRLCGIYTDLVNPDWPDIIEKETGKFIYFGDNRSHGKNLHETPKGGNQLLKYVFEQLHLGNRISIPPFFIFSKSGRRRDVVFQGIAVPGHPDINDTEDLVAIWKLKKGKRFQNYKSIFTILDVATVKREWIEDIQNGHTFTSNAPKAWLEWVETGFYKPLVAERTIEHRTREEQIPLSPIRYAMVEAIIEHFKGHPKGEYAFEECAALLAKMMDSNIINYDLTRPWRDGGRDAIGKYRIGLNQNAVYVDFALEAKCKGFSSGSGIKETSRLISRLRYRQFGIFVTTSYVSNQAYEEIKVDGHPVIIMCANDIGLILETHGYRTVENVKEWLSNLFPYL